MNEEKYVSYFLVVAAIASLAAAYLLGSGLLLVLSLIANLAALVMYFAGGVILNTAFPAFHAHPAYREVELANGCVVALNERGRYQASASLEVLPERRLNEMTSLERGDYLKSLENFLANVQIPVKISILTYPADLDDMRGNLRRKAEAEREAEARRREQGDARGVDDAVRRRLHFEKRLAELEGREIYDTICYVAVSSEDADKHLAVEKARAQREKVALAIATAFSGNKTRPIPASVLARILLAEGYPVGIIKGAARG